MILHLVLEEGNYCNICGLSLFAINYLEKHDCVSDVEEYKTYTGRKCEDLISGFPPCHG